MPIIKIIDSIKIYVYLRDHNPPHFHIVFAEYEELIDIRTLETYSGGVPRKQRKKVIAWAEENMPYIIAKWDEFNPTGTTNDNHADD